MFDYRKIKGFLSALMRLSHPIIASRILHLAVEWTSNLRGSASKSFPVALKAPADRSTKANDESEEDEDEARFTRTTKPSQIFRTVPSQCHHNAIAWRISQCTMQDEEPEDLPENLRPMKPRQSVSAEADAFSGCLEIAQA